MLRLIATAVLAAGLLTSAHASDQSKRQTVLDFYEAGLNKKDAEAALKFVGNRYVQHNPNAADGPEGFRKFIAFLKQKYPNSHSEIKLENGKIVEHWDATQAIPDQTVIDNTMFQNENRS